MAHSCPECGLMCYCGGDVEIAPDGQQVLDDAPAPASSEYRRGLDAAIAICDAEIADPLPEGRAYRIDEAARIRGAIDALRAEAGKEKP